jgi:putative FmdB family regulatory protein
MPIYEYLCLPCGSAFDEIRSVSDRDEPIPCPACSTPTLTRSPPSFSVRGSVSAPGPRSLAEQLAGKGAMKPAGDGSTGILGHKCHSGCGC